MLISELTEEQAQALPARQRQWLAVWRNSGSESVAALLQEYLDAQETEDGL